MSTIDLADFLALGNADLRTAREHLTPLVGSRGAIPVPTPSGPRYVVSSGGHRPHAWELLIDIAPLLEAA